MTNENKKDDEKDYERKKIKEKEQENKKDLEKDLPLCPKCGKPGIHLHK